MCSSPKSRGLLAHWWRLTPLLVLSLFPSCGQQPPHLVDETIPFEPAKRPEPSGAQTELAAKTTEVIYGPPNLSRYAIAAKAPEAPKPPPVRIGSVARQALTIDEGLSVANRAASAAWLKGWSLYSPTIASLPRNKQTEQSLVPYSPLLPTEKIPVEPLAEPLDYELASELATVQAPTLLALGWLSDRIGQFYIEANAAFPSDEVDPVATGTAIVVADEVVVLREQVLALEEEVHGLRDIVESHYGLVIGGLQEENARLREELQRIYKADASDAVPRPNRDLVEEVIHDGGRMAAADDEPSDRERGANSDASGYEVIDEWGRTPEDAATLGDATSTLKGLVVLVPAGSDRREVEELGRQLRAEYADYDNIHIEVFDDAEAAQIYAEQQVTDPAHRVLRITKHQNSGQDAIFYTGGGIPVPVSF